MIIQIILIAILLFLLYRTIIRFIRKQIPMLGFFLWSMLWVIAGIVIVFPNVTSHLANLVGLGRGVDLIVYISIIIIFYAIFRITIKLEHIDHEITKVVRTVALKNIDKENAEAKKTKK